MENTMSMFSIYVVMKPNTQKFRNYNYYHFENKDTWITDVYDTKNWPQAFFMFNQLSQANQKYADGIVIMTYMSYDEVKKWKGTNVGQRGQEYEDFKAEKTDELLRLVEKAIPNFKSKIKSVYSSTPLSYENYYNMPEGAPYGIIRNSEDPVGTTILPVTKTPNLILSGQSVSLHGIFGVTIGSILTASYFVGKEKLIKKFKKYE
jgi:phytoene dehydrogenase-like protein